MERRSGYNPKRRVIAASSISEEKCNDLVGRVSYAGNAEHKRSPGDYGLSPPLGPRPGKTLCDGAAAIPKSLAEKLLRNGLIRSLVSQQMRNGWPQNIWSVHEGVAFEAQLENETAGSYHGYPMAEDDDFRQSVLKEWKAREPKTGA